MPNTSLLDEVANDLAVWIDQTASELALAFAPQGVGPFAEHLTEDEKLEFYTAMMFNPDGSPNLPGRTQQEQRIGAEGLTAVYKQVIKAHPELRPEGYGDEEESELAPPAPQTTINQPAPVPAGSY